MRLERWHKIGREAVVLGLLVIGILAARSTLADHYFVPSGSMQVALQEGDRVFVDKRAYGVRLPFSLFKLWQGASVARGDVVIFDSPESGVRLIKRIVAIGGDEVVVNDGRLLINGKPLTLPNNTSVEKFGDKLVQLDLSHGGGPDFAAKIEPGMVLAMGDHRGASNDGRHFGPVPESEIYGHAVAVYYRRGSGFSWLKL